MAIFIAFFLCADRIVAQDTAATELKALAHFEIPEAKLQVHGNTVLVELQPSFASNSVEIPRLAAPIRALSWQEKKDAANLKLQPELTTWKISWDKRPEGVKTIALEMDAAPLLMSEIKPIQPLGDGSLLLPAHMATTTGDKIRYEPQTFKNTVGYWAGPKNHASWKMVVDRPGKFNLGILQGCGAGNGGSSASIQLLGPGSTSNGSASVASEIEFEVLETGHFQNFVWRHLGEINIAVAGEYELRISPKAIKRAALMDVRAVHLIRLP